MWEYWRHKLSKDRTKQSVLDAGTHPATVEHVVEGDAADSVAPPPLAADTSTTHVFFKDLKLLAHGEEEESEEEGYESEDAASAGAAEAESPSAWAAGGGAGGLGTPQMDGVGPLAEEYGLRSPASPTRRRRRGGGRKRVDRQKLIVILVGLPARGKTFLCNKLMCYLNWLGHPTRHFNVGSYRRRQRHVGEVQDAEFFDSHNASGMEARERALYAALDDMEAWLVTDEAQVAIFDATNSTDGRRNGLRQHFHGRWQYLFIESICNDQEVLERSYAQKLRYSPDYVGVPPDVAMADFRARIAKYEEVYETITDRTLHYIKLIDMVTGRGYMDVNRISGYIPGKLVFFLMQVCKGGVGRPRKIWLTRHGESEYNTQGKIGGNSALSARGATYATLLPGVLLSRVPRTRDGVMLPVSVWTSTLQRTILTAGGLPLPKVQWKALDEIQAGVFDGKTYAEIAAERPDEYAARSVDKLRYRYPSGESYMDVIQRLEPVITEVERERESVCIVAHQAVLRALYGYFMNRPLEEVPTIDIPLHCLMELVPKADGRMSETRFHVDVDRAMAKAAEAEAAEAAAAAAAAEGESAASEAPGTASCESGAVPVPCRSGTQGRASVGSRPGSTGALASGGSAGMLASSPLASVGSRGAVIRTRSFAELSAEGLVHKVKATLQQQQSGDLAKDAALHDGSPVADSLKPGLPKPPAHGPAH